MPNKTSKSKFNLAWLTRDIKKLQNKRDKLYIKAVKSKNPNDWSRFKQARTLAKEEIRKSHNNYIIDIVGNSLHENPKAFWSYIKALRKEKCGIPTLNTKSGIPATSDTTKANTLNGQFQSVFTDEDTKNIPITSKLYPDMPDITFGVEGVIKQFQNINPSKSSGPDQLPARYLKETAMESGQMFHHLF